MNNAEIYAVFRKYGIQQNQLVLKAAKELLKQSGYEEDLNLANMEKRLIIKALTKFKGVQRYAAKALGITEPTLTVRMREYEIDAKEFKLTL